MATPATLRPPMPTFATARVAVAQMGLKIAVPDNNASAPVDPRDVTILTSPRPLSPPGTLSDGWGRFVPIIAQAVPLAPADAFRLLAAGTPFALAQVFP